MANFLNLVTENKSEICSNLFLVVLLICRVSLWLLVQKLFLLKGSILWGAAQAVNVLHQCPVEYLHNGARILWSRIHMYRLNLLTSFVLFFYTNFHKLSVHKLTQGHLSVAVLVWTNWVNSFKFMDNCWLSCKVMAGMKKVYDSVIIFNL